MLKENLFNKYGKIGKSYYDVEIDVNKLFGNAMYNPKEECCDFIESHFKRGEKAEVLSFPWEEGYKKDGKHCHTVSLYLLGLTMLNSFCEAIKRKLCNLIPRIDSWYNFKYTWFLTCLFHDAASCIEKETIRYNPTLNDQELPFYLGNLDIQHTPFNYTPLKRGVSLTRFSESLVQNYFRYRIVDNLSLEHGIIGGYHLFDSLYKNFLEKTAGEDWCKDRYCIEREGLNWRLEHIDHFAYICDTIICHNLWTVPQNKKEDVAKYKAYGLSPLIVNGEENKLDFQSHPLHFMLCLLDTIEPTKRFSKEISIDDVLRQVSIYPCNDGGDNNICIKIEWDLPLEETKAFRGWEKNIINMKNWLSVEVTQQPDRSILIKFGAV